MTEIHFQHCHREANQVAHELAKVAHSSREANQVAHELAKVAHSSSENHSWEGDRPVFVLPSVIRDVTFFIKL
jgi:hypothetical protein